MNKFIEVSEDFYTNIKVKSERDRLSILYEDRHFVQLTNKHILLVYSLALLF